MFTDAATAAAAEIFVVVVVVAAAAKAIELVDLLLFVVVDFRLFAAGGA